MLQNLCVCACSPSGNHLYREIVIHITCLRWLGTILKYDKRLTFWNFNRWNWLVRILWVGIWFRWFWETASTSQIGGHPAYRGPRCVNFVETLNRLFNKELTGSCIAVHQTLSHNFQSQSQLLLLYLEKKAQCHWFIAYESLSI